MSTWSEEISIFCLAPAAAPLCLSSRIRAPGDVISNAEVAETTYTAFASTTGPVTAG